MKFNDVILGIAALLLGGMVVYLSVPMLAGSEQGFGPGLFPGLIGVGFLLCGVLLTLKGIRSMSGTPFVMTEEWVHVPKKAFRTFLVPFSIFMYILFSEEIGFFLISTTIIAIFLIVLRRKVWHSIGTAIVITLAIYLLFGKILSVPL